MPRPPRDPEVAFAAQRTMTAGPASAAEAMMSSAAQRTEAQARAALAQAVSGEAVQAERSFPGLIPLLLGALSFLATALFRICAVISAPLLSKPAAVRHSVGWVAANTVFLASCFWVWMVFFRPPAPTEALPGAAAAGAYDFEKGGLPPVPVQAKEKPKAHGDDAHGKDDHGKQATDKKPEAKKPETKKADDKSKSASTASKQGAKSAKDKPAAGGH